MAQPKAAALDEISQSFLLDTGPLDSSRTEILELPLHITRLPINSVRYSLSTISSVVPVDSAIQRD